MQNRTDNYEYYRLKNGLRLVHRFQPGGVSHLAVMLNAGARDESRNEEGAAHLIEHMMFKGTKKRKAWQVISRMENVGCDLNAYTTKEETCIHASFMHPHYGRAVELFADICFNSVFPQHELEKEKEVILDEIHSYRDNPGEEIVDEFENLIFKNHPLGHNILGNSETVKNFNRETLIAFTEKNYRPSEIVISSVGNIAFQRLVRLVESHFADHQNNNRFLTRNAFHDYKATNHSETRENFLSHCIIGNIAFRYNHPSKVALALLNNVLGGPGLNSRLNLNIREKYGFTYSIDSQYNAYSDTGWFGVYLGTDDATLEKAVTLVYKELKKLRQNSLGSLQLARARQQLIVQMAIGNESGLQEALGIARNHLTYDKVETFAQLEQQIHNVSAAQLLDVANEIFSEDQLSTLIFHGTNT